METKRNLKYFTAPPISIPFIIGWVIIAIGVIILASGLKDLTFAAILVCIVGFTTAVFLPHDTSATSKKIAISDFLI